MGGSWVRQILVFQEEGRVRCRVEEEASRLCASSPSATAPRSAIPHSSSIATKYNDITPPLLLT